MRRGCGATVRPGRNFCSTKCVTANAHAKGINLGTAGSARYVRASMHRRWREEDKQRPPRETCACGRGEVLPSRPECGQCYLEGAKCS